MAVRLEVEGIRAVARLGVSLEERSLPQPVELGVVLWLREEPQHDSLEDTVDYSVLDAVVPRVLAEEHRLVEQLAAHLADAVLAALDGARLERLEVRATKLAPPLELPGAQVSAVVAREVAS